MIPHIKVSIIILVVAGCSATHDIQKPSYPSHLPYAPSDVLSGQFQCIKHTLGQLPKPPRILLVDGTIEAQESSLSEFSSTWIMQALHDVAPRQVMMSQTLNRKIMQQQSAGDSLDSAELAAFVADHAIDVVYYIRGEYVSTDLGASYESQGFSPEYYNRRNGTYLDLGRYNGFDVLELSLAVSKIEAQQEWIVTYLRARMEKEKQQRSYSLGISLGDGAFSLGAFHQRVDDIPMQSNIQRVMARYIALQLVDVLFGEISSRCKYDDGRRYSHSASTRFVNRQAVEALAQQPRAAQIRQLQQFLVEHGLLAHGQPSGQMDESTRLAVDRYKWLANIAAAGNNENPAQLYLLLTSHEPTFRRNKHRYQEFRIGQPELRHLGHEIELKLALDISGFRDPLVELIPLNHAGMALSQPVEIKHRGAFRQLSARWPAHQSSELRWLMVRVFDGPVFIKSAQLPIQPT